MNADEWPAIGVIVVTYASGDVIEACLTSLLASQGADLRIVVCDNASPDHTRELVRTLARDQGADLQETTPSDHKGSASVDAAALTLITSGENRGFAGGVNLGLDYLSKCPDVGQFWILNPDCVVKPDTAAAYARAGRDGGRYGMIGGRTLYLGEGGMIQSDGGWINLWTGVCSNHNFAKMADQVDMPSVDQVDYLAGANFVVSRDFLAQVGPMREDYFLYYEEVDWALRRGDLPIVLCRDAVVLHHGGTSIGSGTKYRAHTAFSNYFNFRSRMMFMRRFRPWALPVSYVFCLLKIVQLAIKGGRHEAYGAWKGLNFLPPPRAVAARLDEGARKYGLGRRQG
jgi:GT2 family glycosyltransferase